MYDADIEERCDDCIKDNCEVQTCECSCHEPPQTTEGELVQRWMLRSLV